LHAIHIEVPAYMTEGSAAEIQRQLAVARQEAAKHLNEWAAPHIPATVATEVLIDERPAVDAIHAAAAKLPKPWIVMGTHGRTGLQRLLLGSVTERTLRESRVPVVTIPPANAS
jgi:nucleotide-binding universal stress UspA family protein